MEYPRYTTFAPGELEAAMRRIGKIPENAPMPLPTERTSKLLKVHECTVEYPDGHRGAVKYERLGPAYHRFGFRYDNGAYLPHLYVTRPLGNTAVEIEAKAQELAAKSFQEAIDHERRDRFCRVTEPTDGSRKRDMSRAQMTAKAAKEQAGKYAVCQRIGDRFIPASSLYDTIDEANHAWKRIGETKYVVACCNRLDRCFDIPKYNPLYKEVQF